MCLYSCVCSFKNICLRGKYEWTQLSWKMEQEACHIGAIMRHSFVIYYKLTSFSYDFAGLQQINLSHLPFGMLCAFKHFGSGISVNNLPSWHRVYTVDSGGISKQIAEQTTVRRECCQFCFRCDCKSCFQLCSLLGLIAQKHSSSTSTARLQSLTSPLRGNRSHRVKTQ